MATRIAARYISCRLSSTGKVISEGEKAAGNVCNKGPKRSETPAAAGSLAGANPSSSTRIYVFGGLMLSGIAADVVWNINGLPFYCAAVGADIVLQSKNKALVVLACTGPLAVVGYSAVFSDLKKKNRQVQE